MRYRLTESEIGAEERGLVKDVREKVSTLLLGMTLGLLGKLVMLMVLRLGVIVMV